MSSVRPSTPTLVQRCLRALQQTKQSLRDVIFTVRWHVTRRMAPKRHQAHNEAHHAFCVSLTEKAHLTVYRGMAPEDLVRLAATTRAMMHAVRRQYAPLPRTQERARSIAAHEILLNAVCFARLHSIEKQYSATRKLRAVRHILTTLITTGLDLWSPVDIRRARSTSPLPQAPSEILEIYGKLFHDAFEGGLQQGWVPLYHALTQAGVLLLPHEQHEEGMNVASVRSPQVLKYLWNTPCTTLSTVQRHMLLIEKHLKWPLVALADHSHKQDGEGFNVRQQIYDKLRDARTEKAYAAWLAFWRTRGFSLCPVEIWHESLTPHRVPSSFACAYRFTAAPLQKACVRLAVALSDQPGRVSSVAGYVLPLLYDGRLFFTRTGLTLSDLKALVPEGGPLPSPFQRLDLHWSPWQHLAAYLMLGEWYSAETTVLSQESVKACLLRCEKEWGPPSTHKGTLDQFVRWHTHLLAYRLPDTEETMTFFGHARKAAIHTLWQQYLDAHALKAHLAPSDTSTTSSRRRRV